MQNQEFFDLLIAEANHPFSGWDFSHISATDRVVEAPLTWCLFYEALNPSSTWAQVGANFSLVCSLSLRIHMPPRATRLTFPSLASDSNWQLDFAVNQLQEAGWHILEQREDHPIMRFYGVGAIVYYLKAIPWQIPDFTIEKYFQHLIAIHNFIEKQGYLDMHMHRFLILALKP